jgi:hypothetical protein
MGESLLHPIKSTMIASNSVGLNCFCISLRLKVKISKMSRNDYSKKRNSLQIMQAV